MATDRFPFRSISRLRPAWSLAVAITLLGAAPVAATVLTFGLEQLSNSVLNLNYGRRVTATSDAVGSYLADRGFTPNVVVSYAAQAGGNYGAHELFYHLHGDWSGSGLIYNADGNENWSVTFTADPGYKVTLHGLHLSRFAWSGNGILPGISIVNENNQVLYSAANVDVGWPAPFALDFGAGHSGSTLTIRMDMGTNPATGAIAFDDITFSQAAAPPTISTQPFSQTATVGTNVTFAVAAGDTVGPMFQWKKGGSDITSATNATLVLNNVSAADAGSYTVVVSNGVGTPATSNPATLTVNAAATPIAVNFDSYTANATLNGQGTPAWVAYQSSTYVDPLVVPGDAGHATNYVKGPEGWRSSAAHISLPTPLVYAAGSGLAEWRCQLSVPAPTASHGNTASNLGLSNSSEMVRFGPNGFAAGSAIPAGYTVGANLLSVSDALGGSHVGSAITPNDWYEVKLLVNFTAPSPTGSLFYRNLTAGQTAFTADPLLQHIDLKLTATNGAYSFPTAIIWVVNGGKIDAISASPAVPPSTGVATFDTGVDGWTIVSFTNLATNTYSLSGNYTATHSTTGGNPGGYIYSADPDGGDFTFAAPAAFLGNRAAAAGGTLSYDLIHPTGGVDLQAADVILVGNGQRLVWQASPTLTPSTTWLPVSVPLSPTPQWHVDITTGATPTATDFQAVLGNLTDLLIRGEYFNGSETSGIDNVRFSAAAPLGVSVITSASTATATVGSAFNFQVTASNSPTSFAATGLPAGLSLNTTSGAISGTPTTAGASTVALTAANAVGTGSPTTLTITVNAAGTGPANDLFANRIALTGLPITTTGSNVGASRESNEPTAHGSSGSVWWTWTALSSGSVTIDTNGSSYDTMLGVYMGTTLGGLSDIASDDDAGDGLASLVTFSAIGGTAYQIAVGGFSGSFGSINLHITGGGGATIPVITSANMTTTTAGGAFTYTIIATNSPTSFAATGLPAGLTVNTTTGVISGTPTATGTSSVTLTATNSSGTSAQFTLTLVVNAPTAPMVIVPPVSTAALVGASVSFTVTATGTEPRTYEWRKGNTVISTGTAATLVLSNVQAGAAGSYSVVVANAVSSVTSAPAYLYVGSPSGVRAIAAGTDHSLFVTNDGTLWAMGSNNAGQVGSGATPSQPTPVPVAFGVQTVAAGLNHTLFLKTDGTLWTMGHNVSGQLGDGTTNVRYVPLQVASSVATMAGGYFHSLFVKTDGTLWGMGDNTSGQLGDGTTTNRLTPVQVSGVADVVAVTGGNWHSLFLKSNGTLWAMGGNDTGQLCDGSTTNRLTPVQVATGVAGVSAGWFHTLFVKTDGALMAAGNNELGQLGDGTTVNRLAPVPIATGVAKAYAQFNHSAFVKTDGTLWTMGSNNHSQLGDGTLVNRPTPASFTNSVAFATVGNRHTLWVKTDGSLWGVGGNGYGQLGLPASAPKTSPLLIAAAAITGSAPVVAITSPANGATFAPSVAINLTAVATDADGTIANVRFYANDVLLGTVNTAPYAQAWTPTATGPIIAYAIATDNNGNQTTSVVVNLAVNAGSGAPVTTHPQPQTKAIGGTATFSVTATGTAPLTYQWKLGPSNVIDGGTISGATTQTLVITGVQPADAGIYTCVVTGGSGSGSTTSNGAQLTITSGGLAPYLTSPVRHQSTVVGGTVTFAVTVGGTPPFTYQWKKDSVNLGSATNATLTLTNVQMADGGSYAVQITGTSAITSPIMALTVANAAPANDLFANATTLTGATTSAPGFNVGASLELREPDHIGHAGPGPGHGGASVWWKWVAPATGAVAVNTLGSSFQTLLAVYTGTSVSGLTLVGANDNGGANATSAMAFAATSGTTYYLAVDGLDGATGTIQLSLAPTTATAPTFVTQPAGITAPAGGTVGLRATVAGTAPFTYLWKKDNVDVPGGTTNPLRLRNVTASAAGSYTLSVTNGVSSATSNAAVLTIAGEIGPLAIFYQPQSLAVSAGGNAVLDLWVTGTPPLTFQWWKNSVALANGTAAGRATVAGATSTTLTLTGVQAGDAGSYTCYVSNGGGHVTSEVATLTVNGATGTPPTVALTSPASSASFVAGTAVSVMASATDADGTVASVQFFANGTSIGTDTSAPYELSWTPATAGSYALTAKAVDNTGLETTSAPVAITVTAPVQAPVITSAATATATVGTAYTFQVTASNSPTSFAATGLPTGLTLTTATGAISGTPTTAGTYPVSLTAANGGGTSAAATLTITVSAATGAPTITQHPAGQVVLAGSNAPFTVAATGTGTLTYQWYFTPKTSTTPQSVAGATSSTYTVNNVQPANEGDYVCIVTNPAGDTTSNAAPLTIAPRVVRIVSQSTSAGANAVVPVQLLATGSENAVGFTILFDPAKLAYVSAVVGAQATDASLNTKSSQLGAGKLGIALAKPTNTMWTAGTQEVIKVTFTVNASLAGGTMTTLTFGDTPILREISDATANALPGGYQGGTITVPTGFEADMNGNGAVSITDWVKVGRIVAGLDVAANGIDFQKADCAGRSSLGNGVLSISDWVQAGRYAAGLDPLTPAGGPTAPNP